jgi:hypothetical protein
MDGVFCGVPVHTAMFQLSVEAFPLGPSSDDAVVNEPVLVTW